MTRTAIVLSKIFISILMAGGVVLQTVLLPLQAGESTFDAPQLEFLRGPMLTIGILFVLCGQIVLVCIWILLSLVRRDAIFTPAAFTYVDIMIGALIAAAALIVIALLVLELAADAGEPGLFMIALGVALSCAALALVLVVMRTLLKKASEQQRYLDEVV